MASFETVGLIKVILPTQQVSDKFAKREFVVTTELESKYPQYVTFQLTQDKCALLDTINVGQEVKVHFNLRGREWNGPDGTKYFNTLEAWRIEAFGSAPIETVKAEVSNASTIPATTNGIADELPF